MSLQKKITNLYKKNRLLILPIATLIVFLCLKAAHTWFSSTATKKQVLFQQQHVNNPPKERRIEKGKHQESLQQILLEPPLVYVPRTPKPKEVDVELEEILSRKPSAPPLRAFVNPKFGSPKK